MITISSSPKLQRIQQVKAANSLLIILQNSSLTDDLNEFATKFKAEYSEIAFERVLNYHFDNCIQSFLKNPANDNPCIINDYERIIEAFFVKFPMFKGPLYAKKLNDSIQWSTSRLNSSNFYLIDPLLKENCKKDIKIIIESEISEIIESIGICPFEELKYNESIKLLQNQTDLDFKTLLLNRYIQYISKNIYGLLIDLKHAKPIVDFFIGNISDSENIMGNMINSIKSGLLNISNSTLEIIFILKEIIPIVRKIDPSGFVLDSCLKETRNYFRQFRKDLNSALLKFLIHHKSFDFTLKDFEEQQKSKFGLGLEYPPPTQQADWKPDPIYVKTFINPDIRTSDPINVLISHLSTSSSSSLAEFYQKQLSERLLKVDSMEEIETIVEEVEMFRNKCGESFVTSLNIMINDIIESRSKAVLTSDSSDFKMTIISHRYWPEIIEKDLFHPEFILEKLSSISSTYSRQQEDKKIIWRPQLDEVKVSLEFPSGIFLFSCPLEAAILINSFDFPVDDPEEEFDLGMTVALTGISDKKLLKNAMRFWLKKRVILSSCTTQFHFRFAQDYDPKESDCIDHSSVLFDKTEAETFADDDESSEPDFSIFKEQYWSILANMFKTFGQISAERIQSTLKMYSKEYSGSLDVLTKFLQSRVKEGVLQSNGNRIILYSLLNKH